MWRAAVGVLCCLLLGGGQAPPAVLLDEDFSGPDGVFVSASRFFADDDLGLAENPDWFSEAGSLRRVDDVGRTDSAAFRSWTRRTDLQHASVTMDVRFLGWSGGDAPWHGITVWLNRTLCIPLPECSAVDDPGGNSGYALDVVNRSGEMAVLKKVSGDARARWPGATSQVEGGTYYELASRPWSPEPGRLHNLAAEAFDLGEDGTMLRITVDGQVMLEVVDDGTVGGPRLAQGGRVGLRSDYADFAVDDLRVSR